MVLLRLGLGLLLLLNKELWLPIADPTALATLEPINLFKGFSEGLDEALSKVEFDPWKVIWESFLGICNRFWLLLHLNPLES